MTYDSNVNMNANINPDIYDRKRFSELLEKRIKRTGTFMENTDIARIDTKRSSHYVL